MKTFNFVYKTIFNNGLYYYGQHKTDNLDDGYYGSSNVVIDLVKNHPELNPKREILRYCNTQKELNYWEKYFINKAYKTDKNCLNINNNTGQPEYVWNYNKKMTEEYCLNCSIRLKKYYSEHESPLKGKHLSEERKRYLSEINTGEKNPNYGSRWSEERRAKLKESSKNRPPVSEATRKKQSESHKGKDPWNKAIPASEEQKRKQSLKMKGRKLSQEICNIISFNQQDTKYMNDGITQVRLKPEYWGEFIDIGFVFGKIKKGAV